MGSGLTKMVICVKIEPDSIRKNYLTKEGLLISCEEHVMEKPLFF